MATVINIGHVYQEHTAPPSAVIREFKYCEQCGRPFARAVTPTLPYQIKGDDAVYYRTRGERFCKRHRVDPTPDIQAVDDYKAQFPGTASQMGHRSMHLPQYDETLTPAASRRGGANTWASGLVAAFRTKGELTAEQMQSHIPGCLTPNDARTRVGGCKQFATLKLVRFLPNVTGRGRGAGVYVLLGVSPDTAPPTSAHAPAPISVPIVFTQAYIDQKLREYFGSPGPGGAH